MNKKIEDAAKINLTKGFFAIVDKKDYKRLSKYKWNVSINNYTQYARRSEKVNGKTKCILMHRFILNAKKGFDVDHINRNGLDNRRCNIRVVTRTQNQLNKRRRINKKYGIKYKGVNLNHKKYRAVLHIKGRAIHSIPYKTQEEAALAYNQLASIIYGKYALLNILK